MYLLTFFPLKYLHFLVNYYYYYLFLQKLYTSNCHTCSLWPSPIKLYLMAWKEEWLYTGRCTWSDTRNFVIELAIFNASINAVCRAYHSRGFHKMFTALQVPPVWFFCVASQLVILHISIPHIMNCWTWMNIKLTVFCWNIQGAGLERLCCCSPGSQFADPDCFKSQRVLCLGQPYPLRWRLVYPAKRSGTPMAGYFRDEWDRCSP